MSQNPAINDARFAAAALRFGLRHAGLTNPNPCVAAIIVKQIDGKDIVVGRGVTAPGGRPHAETQAIAMAGAKTNGATMYVTLEPCSHYGKTPPCADAIIKSGLARVVACMADPDPRVAGQGLARLKKAGISVTTPILEAKAAYIHAPHIISKLQQRPYVFLKMAVSSDGGIGRLGAGQITISGPHAWNYVQTLRAQSDAILVGVGTVLNDNPSLTCRLPGLETRSPFRVVLDARNQMPLDAKILNNQAKAETLILNDCKPIDALQILQKRGVQSVMIEGGAKVARAFLAAHLVDTIHLINAPVAVGADSIQAPLQLMTDPDQFDIEDQRSLGDDHLTIYRQKGFACSLVS